MTATPKLESFMRDWTAPAEEMMRERLAPMAESRKKKLIVDLQFLLQSLEQQEPEGGEPAPMPKKGARRDR